VSRSLLAGLALAAVASALAPAASMAPAAALSSHDDPVVVDNPKISIGRSNGILPPQRDGSERRWTLHDMDAFYKLVVTTTHEGRTTTLQKPLYGHKSVRFALVGAAQRTAAFFRISLEPGGQHHERVIVEANHDDVRLDLDAQNAMRITDREGVLRIGEIQVGNGHICLADSARPEDGPCGTWQNLPDAVRILVCANDECAIKAHP
jgi:hypothetical protein